MTLGELQKILGKLRAAVGPDVRVFLEVENDDGDSAYLVEPILAMPHVRLTGRGAPALFKRFNPKHVVQRALVIKEEP